jgi:hypothetical protein
MRIRIKVRYMRVCFPIGMRICFFNRDTWKSKKKLMAKSPYFLERMA